MNNKRKSYKWINKSWSINYNMLSNSNAFVERKQKYKKWNKEEEICDAWQSYRNWIKKNERGSPTLTGDQSKLVTHAIITHRIAVIEFFYTKNIHEYIHHQCNKLHIVLINILLFNDMLNIKHFDLNFNFYLNLYTLYKIYRKF